MRRMCRGIETDHVIGAPACSLGDQCENADLHSSTGYECVGPNEYDTRTGYCAVCRSRLIECAEPITVNEDEDTETCAAGHELTDFDAHLRWHSRALLDAGVDPADHA